MRVIASLLVFIAGLVLYWLAWKISSKEDRNQATKKRITIRDELLQRISTSHPLLYNVREQHQIDLP